MRFKKMHGLGNDFVILDARVQEVDTAPKFIQVIADRHFGVGCDTVVVLYASQKADVKVLYFNADGSESGACGNASRCVADMVMRETGKNACTLELSYDVLSCWRAGDGLITVDMGTPKLGWREIPLAREMDTLHLPLDYEFVRDGVAVSMGNPHCVFFVDDLKSVDNYVEKMGVYFENHKIFPQKANISFVEVLFVDKFGVSHLRQCTWERGVGLTFACGSAACAVMVAAVRRGLTGYKAKITVDGGDLMLEWRESDDHVLMTGPVAYVFEGNC